MKRLTTPRASGPARTIRRVAWSVGLTCLAAANIQGKQFSSWTVPANLGAVVNSASDDMHPAISPNGLSLYFSSNRPVGTGGFDLWVSQRETPDAPWGPPQNLGTILNSPAGEFAPAFDPSGHLLFFGSERTGGCGGRDLWFSRRRDKRDDFGWEPPVNLGCVVNSAAFDDGPTYAEDETGLGTLFFISARPGGLGDRDVWATTLSPDGAFGLPMNVTELNSPSVDARPAVRRDGLEFFLTSTRPGSIEGATGPSSDIWWATRETTSATWSAPINLAAVNTSFNDSSPALSKDKTTLYFNSDRPGGAGGIDLYVSTRSKRAIGDAVTDHHQHKQPR
jgi:hypothetical protein